MNSNLFFIVPLVAGAGAIQAQEPDIDLYGREVWREPRSITSVVNPELAAAPFSVQSPVKKKCGGYELVITLRARHLGTTHTFNEDTNGAGVHYFGCALPQGVYVFVVHARNSLRGRTNVAGLGYEARLIEFILNTRFHVGWGLDLGYLSYGIPRMCNDEGLCRDSFNVEGALPMSYLTFGNEKTRLVMHMLVPPHNGNKGVYLFSVVHQL